MGKGQSADKVQKDYRTAEGADQGNLQKTGTEEGRTGTGADEHI